MLQNIHFLFCSAAFDGFLSLVFLKLFMQKLFDGKYSQFNIFTERSSLVIMSIIFFDYRKRIIDSKICLFHKQIYSNKLRDIHSNYYRGVHVYGMLQFYNRIRFPILAVNRMEFKSLSFLKI